MLEVWDMECSLPFLELWVPDSSLTNFKLVWKTAAPLTLVSAKQCSDLRLLQVDSEHHFLQGRMENLFQSRGNKMD